MVNWYYVQGSERVGPVGVEKLKVLILKEDINENTYVWKKGFKNWEHLRDVPELMRIFNGEVSVNENLEEYVEEKKENTISFDWRNVKETDEVFFLKIGNDRKKKTNENYYGPYSIEQIKAALDDQRINFNTWIYAAGMQAWIEILDTPINPVNLTINSLKYKHDVPLLLIIENKNNIIPSIFQKSGIDHFVLLGAGVEKLEEKKGSLYVGTKLITRKLTFHVDDEDRYDQKLFCHITAIDEEGKKAIQNYAE